MKITYRLLAIPIVVFVTLSCARADIDEAKAKVSAVAEKTGKAIERGAKAAVDGVQRGTKAAANGIDRGAKATARGVERGADATARAARNVAEKVGSPSEDK